MVDSATPSPRNGTLPVSVHVLVTHEVTASVALGLLDLFHSAGRDWGLIVSGQPGEPLMKPLLVSASGQPLAVANGVRLCPDARFADLAPPDAVCIPELFVAPGEPLDARYDAECAWLRHCHEAGSLVSAACSGGLLMAQAGLLDGLDATTHWAYCDALAERFPRVRLQRQRSLVASGQGQRLVMAGGGTSWQDLGLYLVARLVGVDAAMQLARLYLIDWHHAGQQPYARLAASRQTDDALVTQAQVWAARHYAQANPVRAMAEISGLSERAFVRRFRQATGLSPLAYVQHIRIEEAKQLLESTAMPVDAIAETLGYEDASFFSRLFKREVRLTPAAYRRKFGGLREVLRLAHAQAG
ncbi:MAG: helix-turn-helix domain-containing protein [Burkholderiales bacterium]|nr:MAG: helix-turn-helix domain-containing protein [Burkholderiales bacterium]